MKASLTEGPVGGRGKTRPHAKFVADRAAPAEALHRLRGAAEKCIARGVMGATYTKHMCCSTAYLFS
eukprot:15453117-Alexandrium_andersonii.AAC.1